MSLISELRRRNVFRVGLAYLVAAWLVAQVVQLTAEAFGAPDWIMKLLIVVLVIAFPAVLFFAWAYEITPEGVRRESELQRPDSLTHQTARRLDYITIALVVLLLGVVVADRYRPPVAGDTEPGAAAVAEPAALPPAGQGEAASDAARDRSIAVLPFVNLSDDPENEYFADGLAEEILNRLSQLPELRVAGRGSSFQYKDRADDLRTIAGELNVAHILEGSVRRAGEQVRITAQLVRATDGSQLWSQTYDHTLEDVFRTQDRIAENVAASLDVVMDDHKREMMQRVGVRNVDAFVAFQKAWQRFAEAHNGDDVVAKLQQVNPLFEKATELYPEFGEAWYWQADLHQHVLLEDASTHAELELAQAETERLLSAAAETARTPQLRAFSNFTRAVFSDDWTGLRTVLDRAWEAQTCTGPNWSEVVAVFGWHEGLLGEARRYEECHGGLHSTLAFERMHEALLLNGHFEEALAYANRAIRELGQSDVTSTLRVEALLALGRTGEALVEARLVDGESRPYGFIVPVALAAAGDLDAANRAADTWLAASETRLYDRLHVYAALGREAEANELAARLDARPAGHLLLGSTTLNCLCGAPFDIASTPRLRARLAEAGLEWPPRAPLRLPFNPFDSR